MNQTLPEHLGGHLNKTHVDTGVLQFFKDEYGCKTLIDIGCGPGGQCYEAEKLGYIAVIGVDGDFTIDRKNTDTCLFFIKDFTKEKFKLPYGVDLAWSCEFVEHVEEKFMDNYMETFKSAKYVAMTYCPPGGPPNKWHFNEQNEPYWIDAFQQYGFTHKPDIQKEARVRSTMSKGFFKQRGLVFVR